MGIGVAVGDADSSGDTDGLRDAEGRFGVPITFFIGRDGTISRKHFGPVSKEQVDREIEALL